MKRIECFELVKMVADDFRGRSDEKTDLKQMCGLIDTFASEKGAVAYEVSIDDEEQEITLSIHCEVFEVVKAEPGVFYDLVKMSKRYIMENSSDDPENVRISFVLDMI